MADALIANEQRFEVYDDVEEEFVDVPFVSLERARSIGVVPIDDTDDEGRSNNRPGKSESTGSLELRFRHDSPGIRMLMEASENKTRLTARYYPVKAHGSDIPYWEGLVFVTSDTSGGSINNDPLSLNYDLDMSQFEMKNQEDLAP